MVCPSKSNVSNRMFRRSNTSAYITASDHWSTGETIHIPADGSLIDPDYVVMATNLVGAKHRSTEPQSYGDVMDKGNHP